MVMRDPERINVILHRLGEAWKRNPDYRLGQLLVNVVRPSEPCPQIFYFEDTELLERLEAVTSEQTPGPEAA